VFPEVCTVYSVDTQDSRPSTRVDDPDMESPGTCLLLCPAAANLAISL